MKYLPRLINLPLSARGVAGIVIGCDDLFRIFRQRQMLNAECDKLREVANRRAEGLGRIVPRVVLGTAACFFSAFPVLALSNSALAASIAVLSAVDDGVDDVAMAPSCFGVSNANATLDRLGPRPSSSRALRLASASASFSAAFVTWLCFVRVCATCSPFQ